MGWFAGSEQHRSREDYMEIVRTKWAPLKVSTVREVYGVDWELSTLGLRNDVWGCDGNG